AVELGPGDAAAAMLAGDEPSFPIDRVAVRVHRRLTIDAEVTVVLREAHDAVIGNVAEQHIASGREVDWPLGPAHAGRDALDRHGAGERRETIRAERRLGCLLASLQMRVRIAAAGQRPKWELVGRPGRRAGLTEWRNGFGCRRSARGDR